MKTEKADTVEIELRSFEAYGAFMALSSLRAQPLPVKTALKVRRLIRDLLPSAKDREEVEEQLLKDYGGTVKENGTVEWETAKGAEELLALNESTVTLNIVPLTEDELEGSVATAAALGLLEDVGILKE